MIRKLFRKKKTALSVQDSIQTVITMIEKRLVSDGWKYIKSKRTTKKVVGDLSFEIIFSSSKWNRKGESIRIDCFAAMYCKKYEFPDKTILAYTYEPLDCNLSGGNKWYDITFKENFGGVVEDICFQLTNSIVLLASEFEEDFKAAGIRLSKEGLRYTYPSIYNDEDANRYISIPFIDEYIGHEAAIEMARKYYYEYLTQEQRDILLKRKDSYKKNALSDCKTEDRNHRYILKYFDEL